MAAIKIIATPSGEAPLHIREAWVGLVLPLVVPKPRLTKTSGGVLTGPKTYWGYLFRRLLGQGKIEVGYAVNVQASLMLLSRVNPSAAQWWHDNVPYMMTANRTFLFCVEACEETEDIVWPPPPNPSAS